MPGNTTDHPQTNWRDCFQENQAYRNEIRRLNEEVAELQRKQRIAIDNAYAEGYEDAKEDAQRERRK